MRVLLQHRVDFVWNDAEGEQNDDATDMAFSKKRVEDRKKWLGEFVPGSFIDFSMGNVTYTDFVDKELILFSRDDNLRSIPCMVDGLKPGQRKVSFHVPNLTFSNAED